MLYYYYRPAVQQYVFTTVCHRALVLPGLRLYMIVHNVLSC